MAESDEGVFSDVAPTGTESEASSLLFSSSEDGEDDSASEFVPSEEGMDSEESEEESDEMCEESEESGENLKEGNVEFEASEESEKGLKEGNGECQVSEEGEEDLEESQEDLTEGNGEMDGRKVIVVPLGDDDIGGCDAPLILEDLNEGTVSTSPPSSMSSDESSEPNDLEGIIPKSSKAERKRLKYLRDSFHIDMNRRIEIIRKDLESYEKKTSSEQKKLAPRSKKVCPQCGKSLKYLLHHIRKTHGIRDVEAKALVRKLRKGTGEMANLKPMSRCPKCGEYFVRVGRHLRRTHNVIDAEEFERLNALAIREGRREREWNKVKEQKATSTTTTTTTTTAASKGNTRNTRIPKPFPQKKNNR